MLHYRGRLLGGVALVKAQCAHLLAWWGPMTRSSSGILLNNAAPSWLATHPARTSFKSPICALFRFACRNAIDRCHCRHKSRWPSLVLQCMERLSPAATAQQLAVDMASFKAALGKGSSRSDYLRHANHMPLQGVSLQTSAHFLGKPKAPAQSHGMLIILERSELMTH